MIELPIQAGTIALFAHGSGSGQLSLRNRQGVGALHRGGLATLLLDPLTETGSADRHKLFDTNLLAQRLRTAMHGIARYPATAVLPLGLFGANTSAAALPKEGGTVVSRGGRPDLAGAVSLPRVTAPTRLTVGGADREVLALNAEARSRMACVTERAIIPGAGHLFEEPGALERAGQRGAA